MRKNLRNHIKHVIRYCIYHVYLYTTRIFFLFCFFPLSNLYKARDLIGSDGYERKKNFSEVFEINRANKLLILIRESAISSEKHLFYIKNSWNVGRWKFYYIRWTDGRFHLLNIFFPSLNNPICYNRIVYRH